MQFVRGILRDVIQNTVMYQGNLGIQNAVSHRNLESWIKKYGNMSQEFWNTDYS
jgi:hypothetical protein